MPHPSQNTHPRGFAGPQGAPRGFLRLYILHRISTEPARGYDILREIESKTEGSWRPGAGSVYPILKELVAEGYIKAEPHKSGTSQRVYDITPEGTKFLEKHRDIFDRMGKNWGAMRRIIIELIDPQNVATLFSNYMTGHLQFARELIESKGDKIPPREVKFMLKEYGLSLERQLDWTKRMIKQL
jgi:DNA-binding PadR family transcriptional regulator